MGQACTIPGADPWVASLCLGTLSVTLSPRARLTAGTPQVPLEGTLLGGSQGRCLLTRSKGRAPAFPRHGAPGAVTTGVETDTSSTAQWLELRSTEGRCVRECGVAGVCGCVWYDTRGVCKVGVCGVFCGVCVYMHVCCIYCVWCKVCLVVWHEVCMFTVCVCDTCMYVWHVVCVPVACVCCVYACV